MPKLWNETIEAHRHQVREAIMETAAELAAEHGSRAVTMSRVAEQAGIGRATLYRYFPDVAAILAAWHEQRVERHLGQLVQLRDSAGGVEERLAAVLEAYARLSRGFRGRHDHDLVAALHHSEHAARAGHRLHELVRDLLADGAAAGELRDDVPPDELAGYCLHALAAVGDRPAPDAVRRLVSVIVAGVRSPST